MRAIAVNEWGGRDKLELMELDPPPLAPDGVLLRVKAAALNPVDVGIREGRMANAFPHHFPVILGWDAAGVVEAVGAAVTWFKPGDRAYGYCRRHELEYGTFADFTTVPEGYLAHMPEDLTFEQAAALPLAGLTAHQGLEIVGLRGGEYLFVTGGAGGVGHMVVQLGVARGARVAATASPANHAFLRELGAEPFDYHDPDLLERWREWTGGAGADAAFDAYGGESQEQAFSVMRKGGRLVSIRTPPEPRAGVETRYEFVRPSGYDLGEHITPLIAEGGLAPHIQQTWPLEAAAEAMEVLEGGHVRGKLVLTL
ncbi:NADP-dependent oxidoreductase [Candidatus Solirubrobacter pratensis]|uniref:NADP-dependent oxidoreductase n=1 Tax=Candidatus Solirubrobacter pratensis TaxID=1298857 RepID=UPI0004087A8E|nr:NADP-dependent oxidoreductase [Candidatus Solirubrobacter pratensis]